jgi:hypothetical protein
LLNAVREEVILSPARFSMDTNTSAHLTRSSVEVVPNRMRADGTHTEACACLQCTDNLQVMIETNDAEESSAQTETISALVSRNSALCAIDVYATLGCATTAMMTAGFDVVAMVEPQQDFHIPLLSMSNQSCIFTSLIDLTRGIGSGAVQLPTIHMLHATISASQPATSIRTPQPDSVMSGQDPVRLVVEFLHTHRSRGHTIPVVIFTFSSRRKVSLLDSQKRTLDAMGYTITIQTLPTSRMGSPIHTVPVLAILQLSREPFPTITPNDDIVPIRSCLQTTTASNLPYVRAVPDCRLVCTKSQTQVPKPTPTTLGYSPGARYYSIHAAVPRIVHTWPLIVVNASASQDQWRYRALTDTEAFLAYELPEAATQYLSTAPEAVVLSFLSQAIPVRPLTLLFQSVWTASKVGGLCGTPTDCLTTLFHGCLQSLPASEDGVLVHDLVLPAQTYSSEGHDKKRKRASPQESPSPPRMYEFFSGSAVLASKFEDSGWEVHTVDLYRRRNDLNPTIQLDINLLAESDIEHLFTKEGTPDHLHFAPPCTARSKEHPKGLHYDQANGKYTPKSNLARLADESVTQCFKIIDTAQRLNPSITFTIENPNYCSFKQLPRVADLIARGQFCLLNLNDYDRINFTQKPSCWIHNVTQWKARPRSNTLNSKPNQFGRHNSHMRNTYPEALCIEVVRAVESELKITRESAAAVLTRAMSKSQESEPSESQGDNATEARERDGRSLQPNAQRESEREGTDLPAPPRDLNTECNYHVSFDDIRKAQSQDPTLCKFKKAVTARQNRERLEDKHEKGQATAEEVAEAQSECHYSTLRDFTSKAVRGQVSHMRMSAEGIVVYAMANGTWPVPVINSDLGRVVINLAHNSLLNLHIGRRKMLHWIRERFWWQNMYDDVRVHTKTCKLCQKMKFTSSPGYGFMQLRCYDRPARCICIDIVVLKHRTAKGTQYLFTILDAFSHYPDAYPMSDSTAETCAQCLLTWCQYNGMPEEVRSDRGNNLNLSEVFKSLYELLGIDSSVTHPYSPQGNPVERYHRWLGAALRMLYYERDLDVDESLPYVLWISRCTQNRTTQFTPFFLHFGREARFPLDVFDNSVAHLTPHEYANHLKVQMQFVWKEARVAIQIAQDETAKYYNQKHGILRNITVGSKVLRAALPTTPGDVSTHILPRCSGPYRVLRVSTMGAKIKHMVTGDEVKTSLRQLRPYLISPSDTRLDEDEQGQTAFEAGQLVAVRMKVPKTAVRKWQIVRLLRTDPDQKAWIIQWYSSQDQGNLLNMRYYPVWVNPEDLDKEVCRASPPEGYVPLEWTVYKGRFITPAFKLKENKLPPHIRALIRAHSVSKPQTQ